MKEGNRMKSGTKSSIGLKLYVFIIVTVLAVGIGTAFLAYRINANQIDRYYKDVALDTAVNFASMLDVDYIARLREAAESDEFQALRDKAEKEDNEQLIEDYLVEHDLWEGYVKTRNALQNYLDNMESMKYLYIVAIGDKDALYDMYLLDDYDNPLYETGYYEEREVELRGVLDARNPGDPMISTGDWGWLCSAYAPVYDSDKNLVCNVGCDFEMNEVMAERHRALLYIILAAIALTCIVLAIAVVFINRIVIRRVNRLSAEMNKFRPAVNAGYEEAGVVQLESGGNDEITRLYEGIHSMQISIIDYLSDVDVLQRDVLRAAEDIRDRDERIGQITQEAYKDSLTGVGSKAAYVKKSDELDELINSGEHDLAIVMVDLNDLKMINDKHGHRNGDMYIKGSCRMICEAFKHSPVYRIGGDEFVVILQGQDYENRHDIIEQIRADFDRTYSDTNAEPWERYAASIGMAELASDDMSLDLVFKRADRSMYEDKQRFKEKHGSYR